MFGVTNGLKIPKFKIWDGPKSHIGTFNFFIYVCKSYAVNAAFSSILKKLKLLLEFTKLITTSIFFQKIENAVII